MLRGYLETPACKKHLNGNTEPRCEAYVQVYKETGCKARAWLDLLATTGAVEQLLFLARGCAAHRTLLHPPRRTREGQKSGPKGTKPLRQEKTYGYVGAMPSSYGRAQPNQASRQETQPRKHQV